MVMVGLPRILYTMSYIMCMYVCTVNTQIYAQPVITVDTRKVDGWLSFGLSFSSSAQVSQMLWQEQGSRAIDLLLQYKLTFVRDHTL